MRILTQGAIAAGLLTLTACGGSQTPAENAADNVSAVTENQADYLEDVAGNTSNDMVADSLENQADAVRAAGANEAAAIESNAQPPADVNGM